MSKKTLSTILQLILFTGFGLWIVFYMSGKMTEEQKAQMVASFKETRLWFLIPIFLLGFLSHVFRALRWKLLMQPVGIYPSTKNTILSVLIGYIANLFLPRMGELAKCTVLAKYEGVRADKLFGTIVAERLFDLICLLILVGVVFYFQRHILGQFFYDNLNKMSLDKDVLMIIMAIIISMVALIVFVLRKKGGSKIARIINGLGAGVSSIFKLKQKGWFLLHTFFIWLCYGSLMLVGFWSLPATEHLGIPVALVVLLFGSFGMIFTQGGIGAYTYLCAEILVYYQVNYADGIAFGWLSWLVQTGIVLILGVAALILLPLLNKKGNEQTAMDKSKDSNATPTATESKYMA